MRFVKNAFGQPQHPGQWHANPGRPIGGLIGNLIGGFLDQEEFEQSTLSGARDLTAGSPILFQERARCTATELGNETITLRLINRRGSDPLALHQCGAGIIN